MQQQQPPQQPPPTMMKPSPHPLRLCHRVPTTSPSPLPSATGTREITSSIVGFLLVVGPTAARRRTSARNSTRPLVAVQEFEQEKRDGLACREKEEQMRWRTTNPRPRPRAGRPRPGEGPDTPTSFAMQ